MPVDGRPLRPHRSRHRRHRHRGAGEGQYRPKRRRDRRLTSDRDIGVPQIEQRHRILDDPNTMHPATEAPVQGAAGVLTDGDGTDGRHRLTSEGGSGGRPGRGHSVQRQVCAAAVTHSEHVSGWVPGRPGVPGSADVGPVRESCRDNCPRGRVGDHIRLNGVAGMNDGVGR